MPGLNGDVKVDHFIPRNLAIAQYSRKKTLITQEASTTISGFTLVSCVGLVGPSCVEDMLVVCWEYVGSMLGICWHRERT